MQRIWNIVKPQLQLQQQLVGELGIPLILSQLLINRGVTGPGEAAEFLNAQLSGLASPQELPDVASACRRIQRAIKHKEKIMVFGDYDADGLTSTALLKSVLKRLGLEVIHYIPHRVKEGYGLNKQALKSAKEESVGLFISVDCGTTSSGEIEQLKRMGIDTIVIDHHQPTSDKLPPALALINPKRPDSRYKYKDLAGVGVVFRFVQALTREELQDELDLVCLGTIADVVPLNGENRILTKHGLLRLHNTTKAGLRALIKQSRLKNGHIDATSVGYIIGPRINASGRVDSAEVSLRLLMSDSEQEAEELARTVNCHNQKRQEIEALILKEAQEMIEKEVNFKDHRVIVLAKKGWHQGVLGIVASKLSDRFYRPAVIISISDNLCRGSCRSIKNFHILEALLECGHLLERFGGHKYAAGLAIAEDKIKLFSSAINRIARERIALEDLYPSLDIDMEVSLNDWDEELVDQLKQLEPYGQANPEPLFFTRNLRLKSEPEVLSRNTLRFWVTDGKTTYKAVGFSMGLMKEEIRESDYFDLVYTPSMDNWHDCANIQLEIKDIRLFRKN
jgi:single-stranded-DNA-specific exonuclease